MKLLVTRHQEEVRKLFGKKTVFTLHAQIQLTPAEEVLLQKHKLARAVIYDSDKDENVQRADAANDGSVGGFAASLGALRGLTLGRFTVQDLMRGQRVKSDFIEEIARMEGIIKDGCAALSNRLNALQDLDGSELTSFD